MLPFFKTAFNTSIYTVSLIHTNITYSFSEKFTTCAHTYTLAQWHAIAKWRQGSVMNSLQKELLSCCHLFLQFSPPATLSLSLKTIVRMCHLKHCCTVSSLLCISDERCIVCVCVVRLEEDVFQLQSEARETRRQNDHSSKVTTLTLNMNTEHKHWTRNTYTELWHWTLALNTNIEHWTLSIEHYHWTRTRNTYTEHLHWTLTLNSGTEH